MKNKKEVLARLTKRINYILEQSRLGQRPPEYFRHKGEVLNHLRQAVMRVHEGKYGFCLDCDRFIGIKRLKVAPGAIRCIGCQTSHEKEARRH